MKEFQRNECSQKYPALERMNLTEGVVGGFVCQLASLIETLTRIENTMNKTIFTKKQYGT